jgi:Zn finger protein HypA/HybF involved in hydrogenase expression
MNVEAVLLIAALIAAYLLVCWIWPYAACGRCEGGKKRSPSEKYWRICGRCEGKGRRIRTGRYLLGGTKDL